MMKVYTCVVIRIFMFVYEIVSGGLAGARIKSPQLTRKCMYCFTACKTIAFPLFLSFVLGEDTDCFQGLCNHPRARNWVQCERCGRWFHCVCQNVTLKKAKDVAFCCC